jgi:outer membrane immunogenic protein
MRHTLLLSVLAGIAAAPAFAGTIEPVAPTPVPVFVEPAPVYSWTGGYVGAGLGFAGLDFDVDDNEDFGFNQIDDRFSDALDGLSGFVDGFDDDGVTGGFRAGYDFALANGFLVGGRLDYDFVNFDLNFEDDDDDDLDMTLENGIDGIYRAGVRLGYAFGPNLVYGIGGYAGLDANDDSDGYFAGIGAERFVTENVTVGGEVLYHEFDEFEIDSLEADITTVGLNVNFRF